MTTLNLSESGPGHFFRYDTGLRTTKRHGLSSPEHFRIYANGNRGGWFKGTGGHGWPIYRLSECVHHIRSGRHSLDTVELWEFCNEESVEHAVEGGLAQSFCMPPYGRSFEEIVERYRYLRFEGCWVIYYVWNNDDEGHDRAFLAYRAAKEAGIVLQIIGSLRAWPCCPPGGSIVDIPGTSAEHVDALLKHCNFDIDSCSDEFIAKDESESLPHGASNPKPIGDWWIEEQPAEPEKQKNDAFSHERVRLLACALGNELRADHEQATAWLHFDGTKWAAHHSNDKANELLEALYDRWDWTIRDATTVNSDRAGVRRAVGSDLPAANTKCLPFTNGCLDLATKALIAHSPEHGNRYCLPFAYESGQPTPTKILSFLADRLGSPEVVQLYRAFIWHILTNTCMKAYLEITGPGNTGKTVLTNLVIALIGIENTTSCSLKRIEDTSNRFETNRIRSKRLAVFSESQEYSGPLEMLKALTGQDRIPAERKHSSAIFDYVFTGGVILTGNSPIRSSDTTGAVINRRRSIIVDKVVAAANERVLIEFDGYGGLRGELVPELPAFVDWVLQMPPAEARRAIARDVASSARADAEKQVLLRTDHLAAWANENLIFDDRLGADEKPFWSCQVGNLDSDRNHCLLPHYKNWLEQREQVRSYGQRNFKNKLVDLLRDTIGLPLPPGDHSKGFYRVDGTGSVVPFIRFRRSTDADDVPGVIDSAFAKRVAPLDQRVANDQNPVGNGTNGSNDKLENHLPCEMEIGQEGSNREVGVEKTRLTHLFHWTEGSQRLSPVCQPLGSGADAFSEGDDPAWGPRPQ